MPVPKPKFETARTRHFRAGKIDGVSENTIANIEKFGCAVLHIKEKEEDRARFSYTVGVFDTSGAPEIIVVGLLTDTAHFLLNAAVKRLRDGADLTASRQSELIEGVDCEFRPVGSKWISHVMVQANRYYGESPFPVLQTVYPDLNGRFPDDEDFNPYFAQPMLQPDAPMTRLEEDFWASNNPKSSPFDWKFPDPPHTAAFLSKTVHEGTEEVTYVSHDVEDGAWQFLGDLMDEGGGPVISCLHHPIDKDPTLKELADLPIGWCATRAKTGDPWLREEKPPEDSSGDTETE